MNEQVLGRKVTEFPGTFDKITVPDSIDLIILQSDEVTGLCPVTGQPDFYTVTIAICPNETSVESKSLKLYLQTFRDRGAFCEVLASEIALDLFQALNPKSIVVTVDQKPRGGISISATSSHERESNDKKTP